jgi:hypothetical protein
MLMSPPLETKEEEEVVVVMVEEEGRGFIWNGQLY